MKNDNDIIIVTPELIAKFISGNVSLGEWVTVSAAMKKHPELKRIIESSRKIIKQIPIYHILANPADVSVCKQYAIRSRQLPVMRLAASGEVNDCVVKCEHYVLEKRGMESQYQVLYEQAQQHDWLHDEGTPLYNIGRLLEMACLSVARRFKGSLELINEELESGCAIIVALNAERLYAGKSIHRKSEWANHAVVVLKVNTDDNYVEIHDPQSMKATDRYPVDVFINAWRPSKNFFVSVIERGKRPYKPHPEYVSHIKLPESIASIADMLAENAHEIWAQKRLAEARQKGANSKQVDDPFMKPFNELPAAKRKTDYLSALNTIRLLYKLGFRIVRNIVAHVEYRPNIRNKKGQYIPHPIPVDDVELPADIAQLTEYIAENTHEEWAKQRFKEGWTFAAETNKALKQSFDLVPYCELIDSEKEYDRNMAMNTLKVLVKMGYRIEKA